MPDSITGPELLAPAGSLAMLDTALAFGAGAIYAGQPRYSLRARNNDFGKLDALAQGIERTHALGRKLYVVSNIYPHNAKLKTYLADMAPVIALKPDALIMADPGLMLMIREAWPEMPIHLSVQANTVNHAAVRFWRQAGVSRVILSRELSLDEIAEIRQECPDTELEVFVHGALCVAYSGRCLLSGYFNHRDPNQGTCTNSCRWDYKLNPASVEDSGDVQSCGGTALGNAPQDKVWLLEEGTRPGQLMPIEEDEHGTYILNSKDLRAIEHVQRLVEIGVDSLKIEGRTKSPYYVARTCQAYRRAIDAAVAGRPLDPRLLGELDGLASRGYTGGFYERHPDREHQNYLRGHSESGRSLYVGDLLGYGADGLAEIEVKNRFARGDRLELIHPAGNREVTVSALHNAEGAAIEVAPGSGHRVHLALPPGLEGAFVARFLEPDRG
ncbi:U32 family peptidase [Denitratisoma sp. DHT3]|uniref:prephenate-dependent tRNA uridine(34) hydroxylase TrhP n=1 Tax=Denitratisoma sp. DHT3 TaxID=1981880 RepID=UPI0011989C9B|nr:tRNA 5-hydroxyuridine modification protein YegQ [Denitratisoma sp. DHT3]QDX81311.1 U32 family peptidase [Denitratisoma sp. DHT3]